MSDLIAVDRSHGKEDLRLLHGVEDHCPWHCPPDLKDENGYCDHLIGFTNDRKVYEPIHKVMIADPQRPGHKYDSGYKMTLGGRKGMYHLPIPSNAILVNPEIRQIDDAGLTHIGKKWVSSRVYVPDGVIPEISPVFAHTLQGQLGEESIERMERKTFVPGTDRVVQDSMDDKINAAVAKATAATDAKIEAMNETLNAVLAKLTAPTNEEPD